ncbi:MULTISPECIES: KGK domain-containing protein [Nostocales]|uniref:KGK family protein n=2 Tax=Tolypothrix TaxID=111782 RepID=A0A0C1N5I5_9CYAN
MSSKFIPLVCDDDVILLQQDTFKISRLKELLSHDIGIKLSREVYNFQCKLSQGSVFNTFARASIGQECIALNEIQLHFIQNCQILRIGGKGWQEGKLKIQVSKSMGDLPIQVDLEFCPDKPDEPESFLDDIRKTISNNTIANTFT